MSGSVTAAGSSTMRHSNSSVHAMRLMCSRVAVMKKRPGYLLAAAAAFKLHRLVWRPLGDTKHRHGRRSLLSIPCRQDTMELGSKEASLRYARYEDGEGDQGGSCKSWHGMASRRFG